MNVVDSIRDPQKIREIKEKLRATNSRNYLLFTMTKGKRPSFSKGG